MKRTITIGICSHLAVVLMTVVAVGCRQKSPADNISGMADSQGCGKAEVELTTRDMGTMKSGDVVGAKFKLRNVGEGPIVIREVEAGCSCTEVRYTKTPIEADGECTIEVILDTRGLSGYQYKTVYVDIEGCEKERIKLAITASIEY